MVAPTLTTGVSRSALPTKSTYCAAVAVKAAVNTASACGGTVPYVHGPDNLPDFNSNWIKVGGSVMVYWE